MLTNRCVGSALTVLLIASAGCGGSSSTDNPGNLPPQDQTQLPPGQVPPNDQTGQPQDQQADPTQNPSQDPTAPNDQQNPDDVQVPEPMAGTGGGEQDPPENMPPEDMVGDDPTVADPRGCPGLDSGFPGDEACLPPPEPGEGIQIHVGPSDYDDPDEINRFVFPPNSETSQCMNFQTSNEEDVFFQGYVLSGRPGTHHIINTIYSVDLPLGGNFEGCMDGGTGTAPNSLGNIPGASKPYMPRAPIAPENANLGSRLPAAVFGQADMHYFNFNDEPILREFWLNLYYISPDEVQEESNQIRGMGGFGWLFTPIQPGTDEVYAYSCPINSPGRIIQLLGHYHAHGRRFTAWLNRGTADEQKVFEMYDYLDPAIFFYNSVTENPGFSDAAAGATSGMLEVEAGDTLDWECHIVNDSDTPLRYTNEVETGEMCNLWGASVGPEIDCLIN